MKMLVLIEQHGADSAFRPRYAFDHGQHHPSHRRILPQHFERLVSLAEDHDFIHHPPFVHPQRARQVELSLGYARDHLGHPRDKKYRNRKNQQIEFERVTRAGHQGEKKREAHHGKKPQLAEQRNDGTKERNDRQVGHQQRKRSRQSDRFQVQHETGDQFAAQTLHPHFAEGLPHFFGLRQENGRRKNPDEKQQHQLEYHHPAHRLSGDHLVR